MPYSWVTKTISCKVFKFGLMFSFDYERSCFHTCSFKVCHLYFFGYTVLDSYCWPIQVSPAWLEINIQQQCSLRSDLLRSWYRHVYVSFEGTSESKFCEVKWSVWYRWNEMKCNRRTNRPCRQTSSYKILFGKVGITKSWADG